jgi:hypothetical protein
MEDVAGIIEWGGKDVTVLAMPFGLRLADIHLMATIVL